MIGWECWLRCCLCGTNLLRLSLHRIMSWSTTNVSKYQILKAQYKKSAQNWNFTLRNQDYNFLMVIIWGTGLATHLLAWHFVNMVNTPLYLRYCNGCNVCVDYKEIFCNKPDLIMSTSLILKHQLSSYFISVVSIKHRDDELTALSQ